MTHLRQTASCVCRRQRQKRHWIIALIDDKCRRLLNIKQTNMSDGFEQITTHRLNLFHRMSSGDIIDDKKTTWETSRVPFVQGLPTSMRHGDELMTRICEVPPLSLSSDIEACRFIAVNVEMINIRKLKQIFKFKFKVFNMIEMYQEIYTLHQDTNNHFRYVQLRI